MREFRFFRLKVSRENWTPPDCFLLTRKELLFPAFPHDPSIQMFFSPNHFFPNQGIAPSLPPKTHEGGKFEPEGRFVFFGNSRAISQTRSAEARGLIVADILLGDV